MPSLLSIFAPPEHAVLSLQVQAAMARTEPEEQSQFKLLIRHFLDRFFNNEMVSSDGYAKMRAIQAAYAIALPGLCVALYLIVPYHAPGGRSFWSQVSDHYFYVMYSFVATTTFTLFEWDIFFPDMVDIFVLSPLSIRPRNLFLARILAIVIFLGLFLGATNALGTVFFPAATDPPSFALGFWAHLVAVTASSTFAATFLLVLQALTLAVLGERLFRSIAPFLQGLSVMMALTILFLFPILSRSLSALMNSGEQGVLYFPPFWFLGIYQRMFDGPSTLSIFSELAWVGCMATVVMIALVILSYPLAYRRRARYLVEGPVARASENGALKPIRRLLHMTLLRVPAHRAIYHFISDTLLRTPRHRVYLAMYGGLGLALVASSAVLLKLGRGHVNILFSPDGLRAAVPIVSFWTIVGLRNAFISPVDRRGTWVFRVIQGKPGFEQFTATKTWVLQWGMLLTLGTIALVIEVAPPELRSWRFNASQVVAGTGLCVLLTDFIFFKVRSIPFTDAAKSSTDKLAFVLIQYFGLFPPLVLITIGFESWAEVSVERLISAALLIAAAHLLIGGLYKRRLAEDSGLMDLDDDEEEFPQRLGLRY